MWKSSCVEADWCQRFLQLLYTVVQAVFEETAKG